MAKVNIVTDNEGVISVKLTDGTETMAQILARIKAINTAGTHVYFDTSAIAVTNPLYLCTIYMNYGTNTDPTIVRLTDQVTGKQYVGNYVATETLAEVLAKAVDAYVAIVVTAVTQDDPPVTVTGQTVSLYEGSDATTGTLRETAAYNGQPVSFMVAKGFEYFICITSTLSGHYNPSTAHGNANALTAVTLTYEDASHVTTFAGIQALLASEGMTEETARQALKGKEIEDTWTSDDGLTTYSNPMVVMDVKTYEDADGVSHLGAKMERKYCTFTTFQFDHQNTEESTATTEPDGKALEGIKYCGLSGTTYTWLNLATGDDIPYSSYDKVYRNAYSDTNLIKYGHNRYRDSAVRQYLNSSAGIGAWWTQKHVGQVAPDQLSSKRGYMAGCSAALLAAAKPVKIQCYTNTVTDGGVIDVISTDKFFLDSGTEVYGSVNNNEGLYDILWKEKTGLSSPSNAANTGRIHYKENATTSAAGVWLRSANRSNSCNVWNVNASGGLSNAYYGAYSANALAPACVIY